MLTMIRLPGAIQRAGCTFLLAQELSLNLVDEPTVWQRLIAGRVAGKPRQIKVEE